MKHYLDILSEELIRRGYTRQPENEALTKRKAGHVFTKEEHLKGLIYSQLSNQRPWEGIVPHFSEIDALFFQYDYERIKQHDGKYFENGIRRLGCGNRSISFQMKGLHHNIAVLEQIINDYGSLDRFVGSRSAYDIVQLLSDPGSKYKIIQLGEALAWEYLRNVGIDGAKPDLHMRRFFGSGMLGLSSQELAPIDTVLNEVDRLSTETGRSKFEIDYIIWSSMSHGICNNSKVLNKIMKEQIYSAQAVNKTDIPGRTISSNTEKRRTEKEMAQKNTGLNIGETNKNESKKEADGLYTYGQAVKKMEEAGLGRQVRANDISLRYRQFGKNCSSLHIKNRDKRFILYATDTDFANIRHDAEMHGLPMYYMKSQNKPFLQKLIKSVQDEDSKSIVLIFNGNRILHNPSESALKHEIVFYTNDSFEFVISVLTQNQLNIK